MTATEKELVGIVEELRVAVRDLHYHLSAESRLDGEALAEAVRRREAFLTVCGQTLNGVRSRIEHLQRIEAGA